MVELIKTVKMNIKLLCDLCSCNGNILQEVSGTREFLIESRELSFTHVISGNIMFQLRSSYQIEIMWRKNLNQYFQSSLVIYKMITSLTHARRTHT